ncbi:hypothetical protein GLYMA_19G076901v4 [Glycine max]|nr:hypothetical protein GLYMA_19G076901v4 [Glycine max]KAH1076810.1 hypothetical protein GYH30_052361 [Glycine max]
MLSQMLTILKQSKSHLNCAGLIGFLSYLQNFAGREWLKIIWTEHLRAWVVKSFVYYLTIFENGIQNQSFVMFLNSCFSEFSASFLQ